MTTPGPPQPQAREEPYAVWEATLAEVAATGGTALLLGATDVGKTTFTRLLVNHAAQAGRRVALLDADLGQSEIGPPTCVGLAFVEAPVAALSGLPPHALAFVGSTSPSGHLVEYLAAIGRLAAMAHAEFRVPGPEAEGCPPVSTASCPPPPDQAAPQSARPLMLIDTSGYVHGAARSLYQAVFDLLVPAHVVALQRHGELEPILVPMRRREGCRIHTPPIPAVIQKKPPRLRAQRRAMRFAAYFQDAQPHTYSFDEVAFLGTWMGSGKPIAAHLLKFLNQTLGPQVRVYYAEMAGRQLGLMVSQPIPPHAPGLGLAQEQLKAQAVSITVAPRLKHLLLGLEGASGKLLGLGLLEALDFRRRTLGIVTPLRAPGAARVLRFGSLRVAPDGTEIGTLKPGEL
ncbi:MAG TPA: Clp1/GlmU family protein [Chthonomonadaceae bacterium]|nr:Clp1/GlmU family protein [Chthonomonadaceae bacterium]